MKMKTITPLTPQYPGLRVKIGSPTRKRKGQDHPEGKIGIKNPFRAPPRLSATDLQMPSKATQLDLKASFERIYNRRALKDPPNTKPLLLGTPKTSVQD